MADEATSYPTLVVATSIVSMTAWLCWAAYDIAKQRKAHPLPCDPDVLGRSSGAMGISRLTLGLARLFWLCFGVFFVLYHLCYENVLHKTDGMEYLSDWTIVLLAIVMGLLAYHSLGNPPVRSMESHRSADMHEVLADCTAALHGACWSSNIVSTAGAWYSFFFFPVCESLEGGERTSGCLPIAQQNDWKLCRGYG
mmetsp:Transcript_33528/g.84444  ORF Transcript_33528/g.84444 Transcript_33528/m.84444 type:complete len:196 (-) Transcript_33528:134-721(-)